MIKNSIMSRGYVLYLDTSPNIVKESPNIGYFERNDRIFIGLEIFKPCDEKNHCHVVVEKAISILTNW